MKWKEDVWNVNKDRQTEFQIYEMEYVKVSDNVIIGDSYIESYNTLKEAKDRLKKMVCGVIDAGIIFEVDFKNKRYRQVCSNWGEWDNTKQKWQPGTYPDL